MRRKKQPPDQHQKGDFRHDDKPQLKRKATQRPFGMYVAVPDVTGWRRVDGDMTSYVCLSAYAHRSETIEVISIVASLQRDLFRHCRSFDRQNGAAGRSTRAEAAYGHSPP